MKKYQRRTVEKINKVKLFDKDVLDLIILLEDCDMDKDLTYEQIAYKILEKLNINKETTIREI